MNEIVPLTRPLQSQVTVDSVAKECPSDGFNYPKFSLLNKHSRVYVSQPLQLESGVPYQLLDTANSKGWFVAVKQTDSGSELVFSTLEDLRSAINQAKGDSDVLLNPKRTVPIPSRANIVKFACSDTRLLVGQDNGSILLFDTAQLFTEGGPDVHPLTSTHFQRTYLRYIVPNPGTEPGLSDLVAIVANGKVQLVNGELEPQGGWAATDDASQPISVDWSPKGKHIAIGIQTGDILTFSLTNRTTPHKHLPPTASGPLVSLQWLGPGHTFRTTYANAVQHIIILEAKSASAIYYAPEHPFPVGDRATQNAYTISLPKWDTDASSNDDSNALTIVGDLSSVDIEVLGNSANAWFRYSQDNPVTLPLDSAMDDTYLLSLEVDLTDSTSGQPIVYAYLNDGSVQGWHLETSKPYAGMIAPAAASMAMESGKDADMGAEAAAPATAAFGQRTSTTNAFGQTSFGSQTSSFSSQTTSAFGQTSFGAKPATTSAFGQSSFGQPSAFGQPSQPATTSSFGSAQPALGFAAFGSSGNNAFGSGGAFGSGAFGGQSTGNAFGQTGFGNNTTTSPASGSQAESSTDMTREASMSDSTPTFSGGFGGLGLGGGHPTDPKASNNMFGSFGASPASTPAAQTSSGFGGSLLKPATGFGAFAAGKTTSAFSNPAPPTVSAFGSAPASTTALAPGSGFGQSGFGAAAANPSFGKPAFGQPAFGSSTFGNPSLPTPAPASGGGFAAFASAPTNSLAATAQTTAPASSSASSGGFAAFASKPAGFGAAASSGESKPATGFGAFASSTPLAFSSSATPSAFGSSSTTPAFGSTSTTPAPAFGSAAVSDTKTGATPVAVGRSSSTPASATATTSTPETPAKPEPAKNIFGGPNIVTPVTPSGTPKDSVLFSLTEQNTPTNVFSGIKTAPSPFAKPATGFGAFGNTTPSKDSPFFKKPEETPAKPVSVFGIGGASTSTTPATPTPLKGLAFGAPSAMGSNKSAFAPATPASATTPTKVPAVGGFGAFSGNNTGFASLAGKQTSFGALLKSGGDEIKGASAPALTEAGNAKEEEKDKAKDEERKPRTSVLNTPLTPPKKDAKKDVGSDSALPTLNKDESTSGVQTERTLEWISATSGGSSFVEVDVRDAREGGRESEDEDVPHSDAGSFLTDDSEQPDIPLEEEEDEEEHKEQEHEEGEEEEEEELEEGEEGEQEDEDDNDLEEADIPASARSPSATPQPETPAIRVTQDGSDTPTKAGAASSHSSPSPFGLGLGRPSTRPTRSSPLAKAVSNDDEEEHEENDEGKGKKPAVSPRSPVAVVPLKAEDDDKDTGSKRPKTPPLLSTLGGIAAPTPSIFGQPGGSIFGQAPSTSIFGKPAVSSSPESASKENPSLSLKIPEAGASMPNFFGKPLDAQSKAEVARPATVPATGGLGIPPPTFASSSFELPSLPKTASSAPNVFGGIKSSAFSPTPGVSSSVPAPISVFGAAGGSSSSGAPPAANMFGSRQAPTSMFGGQPATPSPLGSKPSVTSPPSMLPPMDLFGNQKQPALGTPANPVQQAPVAPAATGFPGSAGAGSPSRPQEPENNMQLACRSIVINLEQDLLELKKMMVPFAARINSLSEPRPGGTTIAVLSRPENWSLDNVKLFGEVLLQYSEELDLLETERESYEKETRDVQNSLVKVGMKKEEVSRFMKAKNDKEFAKMLKSRALGPEHSEMQARLRKSIRMMRDRVQKLETRLVESKKKLAEANSCKPSFKPPTIDTINRTYRNIEIALEQQSDEVSRLANRISHLKVDESGAPVAPSTPARSGSAPREGTPQSQQRPYNISTSVAETTAAALNGERSAARLKKVLLRVRKEPLLNTQALDAPPPPLAYDSPRKPSTSVFGASAFDSSAFGKPFDYPTPPLNGVEAPLGDTLLDSSSDLNKILDFSNLPDEDEFHPTDLSESSGRRAGRSRSHKLVNPKKGVPFVPKTPQEQSSPPPPSTFNWGPLPKFGASSSPPIATPAKFVPFASPNSGGSAGPSAPPSNFFSSPSPPSKATAPVPKGFVSFSSPSLGSK
ncbi:hypothetical protein D9619_004355 [Psilocybe cf. subviscida]|uniref:Nucleoporin Nup159/Nup146 N-terminal domain-containing protein n=1 Tax=Psilocybe cf. subviscida TaxID=2480587 RepID=A0A8H5F7U1_9AGAR|nr:hypothetical protein D9619_004355 [Psilocybe cf. subviscida]